MLRQMETRPPRNLLTTLPSLLPALHPASTAFPRLNLLRLHKLQAVQFLLRRLLVPQVGGTYIVAILTLRKRDVLLPNRPYKPLLPGRPYLKHRTTILPLTT